MTGQTLTQIYDSITTEIQSMSNLQSLTPISSFQDLLQQLNSTSKVSVSSLLTYVVAYSEWLTQNNMINFYNEIENKLSEQGVGDEIWLEDLSLAFQEGDMLLYDSTSNSYQYENINTSNQIIKSVSVKENDYGVLIKVRGRDADLLTTEQLRQFNDYLSKKKILGQKISVLNVPADNLKFVGTIKFNAQLTESSVRSSVESVINDYIENLEFGSIFLKSELIERVMGVCGVRNFTITTLEGKSYSGTYATITDEYEAYSGYLSVDGSFPLSTNLTLIPIK